MIEQLIAVILKAAAQAREDAGYGGRHDDGGASRLEDQVKFYNYGRAGAIPAEWKPYAKHLDPDYQKYLELKKKFG